MKKILSLVSIAFLFIACQSAQKTEEWAEAEDGRSPAAARVNVKSVEELLKAINNDTVIAIDPGEYTLPSVGDYKGNPKVKTDGVLGGYVEYVIHNVENLRIMATPGKPGRVKIYAEPTYADVLSFVDSKNIHITNIIFGHRPDQKGECEGGVLAFTRTQKITIDGKTELFGSGTYGVVLDQVTDFEMKHSTIRESTYGIATVVDSKNVRFNDVDFKYNGSYELFDLRKDSHVEIDRSTFVNNRADIFFSLEASTLKLTASKLFGNIVLAEVRGKGLQRDATSVEQKREKKNKKRNR